jgi:hypothetical protein
MGELNVGVGVLIPVARQRNAGEEGRVSCQPLWLLVCSELHTGVGAGRDTHWRGRIVHSTPSRFGNVQRSSAVSGGSRLRRPREDLLRELPLSHPSLLDRELDPSRASRFYAKASPDRPSI